jgi:hypothetical protein
MQLKLASLVLLGATDSAHAIQRRDLVGSIGNIISDLRSIRTNIENTANGAIGSWNGQAKTRYREFSTPSTEILPTWG